MWSCPACLSFWKEDIPLQGRAGWLLGLRGGVWKLYVVSTKTQKSKVRPDNNFYLSGVPQAAFYLLRQKYATFICIFRRKRGISTLTHLRTTDCYCNYYIMHINWKNCAQWSFLARFGSSLDFDVERNELGRTASRTNIPGDHNPINYKCRVYFTNNKRR